MKVRGLRAQSALVVSAAVALAVAACTASGDRPANDPRFIRAVRDFYNANAIEAGCDAPQIVLLRTLETVQSFPGQGVLRMQARFEFEQRDPQSFEVICSGSGNRFFSVLRSDRGPVVVQGMSGPRRPSA